MTLVLLLISVCLNIGCLISIFLGLSKLNDILAQVNICRITIDEIDKSVSENSSFINGCLDNIDDNLTQQCNTIIDAHNNLVHVVDELADKSNQFDAFSSSASSEIKRIKYELSQARFTNNRLINEIKESLNVIDNSDTSECDEETNYTITDYYGDDKEARCIITKCDENDEDALRIGLEAFAESMNRVA